jgi:hypothetical protein
MAAKWVRPPALVCLKQVKRYDRAVDCLCYTTPRRDSTEPFAKGTQGRIGFGWNIAVWIPTALIPTPVSIIFGIMEGVMAGYVAFATQLLAGYTPKRIDACSGSGAHEFHLPSGANESFFEAAARLNATATDPFTMCKSFVQEWQYGMAIR